VVYSAANFGVRQAELKRSSAGKGEFELGPARRISPGDEFVVQEFAPDKKSLVVGEIHQQTRNDRVPPTFWLWQDGDPARARKLAENFPMTGYRLAAGGGWGITTDYLLPDVWLWNPQTGERVRNLGIPLGVSSQISSDGRWVITSTREEFVLWDTESWLPKARWAARPNQRTGSECACSRDGKLLAALDANGRIDLFALPEGRLLLALPPPRRCGCKRWCLVPMPIDCMPFGGTERCTNGRSLSCGRTWRSSDWIGRGSGIDISSEAAWRCASAQSKSF
jgi:hypothetical protein